MRPPFSTAFRLPQTRPRLAVDANAYYLADRNVGRAPKEREYGPWRFPEPRTAHGLGYDASAVKTLPVKKHWAARVQASVYGKFYWDAHDYEDLNARIEAGPVYRSGSGETALTPFAEKRWYGTEAYSHTAGGVLRCSHNLSPKTMLFASWQTGYKKHEERDYLDGASHGGALSLVYQSSPQQYFVFGAGRGARKTPATLRKPTATQACAQAGRAAGQAATACLLRLTAASAAAFTAARIFFNIRRRDTEYFVLAAVGHKKLSWKSFTPHLNWTWSVDVIQAFKSGLACKLSLFHCCRGADLRRRCVITLRSVSNGLSGCGVSSRDGQHL